MATYDRDLQAAVDATSVAHDAGTAEDLESYLRQQLAEREIETNDDAWLTYVVEQIRADPNYMIDREPEDFEKRHRR
ncbi:hypothetical protein [Nocardioides sp.]|uniref:hypothetical protein n=1 Tax=Nocardioides sp. TaxID=35761 RepID=UPI002ED237CB